MNEVHINIFLLIHLHYHDGLRHMEYNLSYKPSGVLDTPFLVLQKSKFISCIVMVQGSGQFSQSMAGGW